MGFFHWISLKSNGKIPLLFGEGSPCDANFCVGLQKYIRNAPIYKDNAFYKMSRICFHLRDENSKRSGVESDGRALWDLLRVRKVEYHCDFM